MRHVVMETPLQQKTGSNSVSVFFFNLKRAGLKKPFSLVSHQKKITFQFKAYEKDQKRISVSIFLIFYDSFLLKQLLSFHKVFVSQKVNCEWKISDIPQIFSIAHSR
jgi:hypothetical protein